MESIAFDGLYIGILSQKTISKPNKREKQL